jgi:hypothetical protein
MEVVSSSRRSPQQPFITGRSQSVRDVMVASSSSSARSVNGDFSSGSNSSMSSASRRGGRTNGCVCPSFSAALAQIIQDRELWQQQQQLGSGGSVNSNNSTQFRSTLIFSKDEISEQERLSRFEDCEDTESSTSQGSSPLMDLAPPFPGHVATDTIAFTARQIKIATITTTEARSSSAVSTIPSSSALSSHANQRSVCRRRRVHHHVGFGKVDIRTYNVTVGDHPSCSSGPPLWYVACGWSPFRSSDG